MVYDCIIIGSGMAGLTSALYLARAKKNVMIIENSNIGGTTATLDKIENYPGYTEINGMQLVQNTLSQVSNLGVSIDIMNITSIDFDQKAVISGETYLHYKTLIIASGTSYKRLNLPDEDNYKFKGLSYCAVCDGSLYRNKRLVVVTNGNSAKESIDYLSNITKDIVVVDQIDKYKSEIFKVYSNTKISKIFGNPFVQSIVISSGDNTEKLECDGIFVSLGKETNLDLYRGKIEIINGYINSDENMHTNIDGVFVAGDIRNKNLRQIVTACSDGAIAGTEAIKYLQRNN